jgi:integrase
VDLEKAGSASFMDDDQKHPAYDAACSLVILKRQETSLLPSRTGNPERDKLQMKVNSRKKVSFSWAQAEQIVDHISKMETLGKARRGLYSTLFLLAAAFGLRSSELLALRANDIDFGAKLFE